MISFSNTLNGTIRQFVDNNGTEVPFFTEFEKGTQFVASVEYTEQRGLVKEKKKVRMSRFLNENAEIDIKENMEITGKVVKLISDEPFFPGNSPNPGDGLYYVSDFQVEGEELNQVFRNDQIELAREYQPETSTEKQQKSVASSDLPY